jgi:hypothetical protein
MKTGNVMKHASTAKRAQEIQEGLRHPPKGERNHHAIYHEVSHEYERTKGGRTIQPPERSIVELIVKDKKAVCQICSGVVHELIINTLYRCYDCKMLYKVTDAGYTEAALKVKMGC